MAEFHEQVGVSGTLEQELGKRRPFEMLEEELYLNLMRTAERLSDVLRPVFGDRGLSEPLYNALRIVAARGEAGIPSQSIVRDMVCRSPDMTSLIDRLCKAGLVRRQRGEADRRVVMVFVTEQGRSVLASMQRPLEEKLRALFEKLPRKDQAVLNQLLFEARRHHAACDAEQAATAGRTEMAGRRKKKDDRRGVVSRADRAGA